MKTIPEYLSGNFDEELRVLVAEARGWKNGFGYWKRPDGGYASDCPKFSTSRDVCEELLVDLTDEEWNKFTLQLEAWVYVGKSVELCKSMLLVTARQICVAFLVVKSIIKE